MTALRRVRRRGVHDIKKPRRKFSGVSRLLRFILPQSLYPRERTETPPIKWRGLVLAIRNIEVVTIMD
jgi:hypothetical protein